MKNTQLKVEDIIGDTINKDNICQDQIIKVTIFSAKMIQIWTWISNSTFLNLHKNIEIPIAPPDYSLF